MPRDGRLVETRAGRRRRIQAAGGRLFRWARLTGKGWKVKDAGEFTKRAIEQGVALVPGAPFYAEDPDMRTFRLSFSTADGGKLGGVERLGQAVN